MPLITNSKNAVVKNHDAAAFGARRRNSGTSGVVAPSPVAFQSDGIAVSRELFRLSGDPIGCGVELSFLMRAASLGSAASSAITLNVTDSARCLASLKSVHDKRGRVTGERR